MTLCELDAGGRAVTTEHHGITKWDRDVCRGRLNQRDPNLHPIRRRGHDFTTVMSSEYDDFTSEKARQLLTPVSRPLEVTQ
jgi:hypothetical protein